MKLVGKVFLALLLFVFMGRAEAATEWVQLYRVDSPMAEWINIITDEAKGRVVGIYDNCFTVDIGIPQGARIGGLYLVYSERAPHRGKEPIAVLRVVETAEKFSIGDMTQYVSGGLVRVGDKVVPVAVSQNQEVIYSDPAIIQPAIYGGAVTEGYISHGGPNDLKPAPTASLVAAPIAVPAAPAPVAYAEPVQYNYPPVVQQPVQYNYPPAPAASPPVQYNYPPAPVPAAPQYNNYPQAPAPAPAQSPFPGNVTYPPYPNYPYTGQTQLDFDANKIADARLIRTFPLSQPEMNALEIQFRGAWDLYAAQRYYESFEAFMRQSTFGGNYLSPYWAGMSALKIGDTQTAINLFNNSLSINPYYEPARSALTAASNPVPPQRPQPAAPRRPARRK